MKQDDLGPVRYLDKEPEYSNIRRRTPAFRTDGIPFYGVQCDRKVPNEVFRVGEAISNFNAGLTSMDDLADRLTQEQADTINNLYHAFLADSGLGDYVKEATKFRLENGRLRAKMKRMKEENDES
jgi:hypothetical protein